MTSYLGWLDFTDSDRDRALQVIAALGEHDTVDELGLGNIRDALSDELFPGTSVLHTRARYHFFIPWLYLDLERRRVPSAEVASKARSAELALIDALKASGDTVGTIGIVAGQRLKNLPSQLYWQGQGRLGIRRFRGSRDQYHRALDRFYQMRGVGYARESDEAGDAPITNWDLSLPHPPADFPKSASLRLTQKEAVYLRERIIVSAPQSFFRYLAERSDSLSGVEWPWEYSHVTDMSTDAQNVVNHARNLSRVMQGAALLYNLILADKVRQTDEISEFRSRLIEWGKQVERDREVHQWDLNEFWVRLAKTPARISTGARGFVSSWVERARSNPRMVADNEAARLLITDRERRVKGAQARVDGGRPLERWSRAAGLRPISYRWANVTAIINDLHAAYR
jgi:hypothetical protein